MDTEPLTAQQLVREIKKAGKVRMPILLAGDVTYMNVEKSDLLQWLAECDPEAEAPWAIYQRGDGFIRLDVAR